MKVSTLRRRRKRYLRTLATAWRRRNLPPELWASFESYLRAVRALGREEDERQTLLHRVCRAMF